MNIYEILVANLSRGEITRGTRTGDIPRQARNIVAKMWVREVIEMKGLA